MTAVYYIRLIPLERTSASEPPRPAQGQFPFRQHKTLKQADAERA